MLELVSYLTVICTLAPLSRTFVGLTSLLDLHLVRCLARICLSPPVALVGSRCMDSSRMDTLISSAEKGCCRTRIGRCIVTIVSEVMPRDRQARDACPRPRPSTRLACCVLRAARPQPLCR